MAQHHIKIYVNKTIPRKTGIHSTRKVTLKKYKMVTLLREGLTLAQNEPKLGFPDNCGLGKMGLHGSAVREHSLSLLREASRISSWFLFSLTPLNNALSSSSCQAAPWLPVQDTPEAAGTAWPGSVECVEACWDTATPLWVTQQLHRHRSVPISLGVTLIQEQMRNQVVMTSNVCHQPGPQMSLAIPKPLEDHFQSRKYIS